MGWTCMASERWTIGEEGPGWRKRDPEEDHTNL